MRRLACWVALVLAFFASVSWADDAVKTKGMTVVPAAQRHALLIGVNNYPEPVSSLSFCVKDMQDLAAELEKVGFPKENIHLMVDSCEGELKPTGANIRAQLTKITQAMGKDDFLFIAFSGHGVMMGDTSFLCPVDVDINREDSFLNRDQLFKLVDDSPAARKIFLCDACRNEFQVKGSETKGIVKARTMTNPLSANQHGFTLMSSCAEKQVSIEY